MASEAYPGVANADEVSFVETVSEKVDHAHISDKSDRDYVDHDVSILMFTESYDTELQKLAHEHGLTDIDLIITDARVENERPPLYRLVHTDRQ